MNEPMGRPERIQRKSRSGPPILSSKTSLTSLKKLQRNAPHIEKSSSKEAAWYISLLLAFFTSPFPLFLPLLVIFLFLFPRILIYPWTRHISCPLSRGRPMDIYQPRDIAFILVDDYAVEIVFLKFPRGLLLLYIINRLYPASRLIFLSRQERCIFIPHTRECFVH